MSESDTTKPTPSGNGLRLGVRIGVGAAAALLFVGTVGAAAFVPLGEVAIHPPTATVSPSAGEQSVACAGPLARLSDDQGAGATDVSLVGEATLQRGTTPLGINTSDNDLQVPDNSGEEPDEGPIRISAPSVDGDARVLLGASQTQQVGESELFGLAASECQSPALDSWLVGGSTTTGRTSFVFLSNPTDVAATVDLTIYSEQGPVTAPGARGILVPAGAQRVLSLAGFAPNVTSPVIHVHSSGGQVAAWLQQSIVRGLAPGGVELTGSVGSASSEHVIPGVQITGTTAIAERLGQPGNDDLQAILRAYPEGNEATAMAVTFSSESIGVPDITVNLGATAGVVTDFVLRDIPDGTYTVTIAADHPLFVAARSSVVSGSSVDFAWFQSVGPQTSEFVITAPPGASPRLHLYNPGTVEAVLDIATPDDQTASFRIPAGSAAGVPLGATLYSARASAPLVAAVGYLGDGQVSSFVLGPPGALDGEVTILPH